MCVRAAVLLMCMPIIDGPPNNRSCEQSIVVNLLTKVLVPHKRGHFPNAVGAIEPTRYSVTICTVCFSGNLLKLVLHVENVIILLPLVIICVGVLVLF